MGAFIATSVSQRHLALNPYTTVTVTSDLNLPVQFRTRSRIHSLLLQNNFEDLLERVL